MQKLRMDVWMGTAAVAAVLLMTAGGAPAETWLHIDASGNASLAPAAGAAPRLDVEHSDLAGLSVTVRTSDVALRPLRNEAGLFVTADWPGAAFRGDTGKPGLPVVSEFFIAPVGARLSLSYELTAAATVDLASLGLPRRLAPVQPPIEKVPGALDAANCAFDAAAYATDADLPVKPVVVEEVGLVRGQRLCLLQIHPIAHNPVSGTLTVYRDVAVRLDFDGGYLPPDALCPPRGLGARVLNPEVLPALTRSVDNYLVIVASAYQAAIQPFVAAKAAQGFNVTTWTPPSASNTVIKSHIQDLWGTAAAPDYVLLVGDTDVIPHWTGGGDGSPQTDLPYACMDGGDDWHADLALGRFPVRDPDHLQAIIGKTLLYEQGLFPDPDYLNRAVFMASCDNYTVSEGTHEYVIQNHMDPNGIVSDRLYCHTYNATTQQVRDAFNAGRFWGVFSGHGSETSWSDGPPFSQGNVNDLMNTGMYPVVFSFACQTGSFELNECFTETWVRAAGKGAIAAYGSSVNSFWTEDDILEKRLFDSIFDDQDDVPARVAPVWNDALLRYEAEMGSGLTTRRYFEMYNLMGEPALPFFGPEVPPVALLVSPQDGLYCEGPAGGPFTQPMSTEYTLTNRSQEPFDYIVAPSTTWVTVIDGTGTLEPLDSANVTVSINNNAYVLPNGRHVDAVQFINQTNHDGDTTRSVTLRVGAPGPVMLWSFDQDPNWSTDGEWEFGQPTGQGGGDFGNPDPTSGATGDYVYGVNLDGNHSIVLGPPKSVTLGPLDLSEISETSIRYQRWLNSDFQPWVAAMVQVSNDGVEWVTVWENGEDEITDDAWTYQNHAIWQIADWQPTVWIRWSYRIYRMDAVPYSGWNIDDVELWGIVPTPPPTGACCYPDGSCVVMGLTACSGTYLGDEIACDPNPCVQPVCLGDANCDALVDWHDIDYFVAAMDSESTWRSMFHPDEPLCPFENNDVNEDGTVSWRDIDPLVARMNTACN